MGDLRKIGRTGCLIALVVIIGISVIVLRGPHVSNALKQVILPELEMMSGRRVVAKQIYVNLLPLFVEAKDVKVFDESGSRLLLAKRAKAYINLSGLFDKRIVIRRLVIKEPEITTDRKQAEEIIENVKKYLAATPESALKVKVTAAEIQGADIAFSDAENKMSSGIRGLSGEILIGEKERVRAHARSISIKKEGWPEIVADFDVGLSLSGGKVVIERLRAGSFGSKITGSGEYVPDTGTVKTTASVLMASVKKIFSLGRSGEGEIKARGVVSYLARKVSVDLKIDGNFYIQTLMELLKVKDRVEGLVSVSGEVKGPIDNVRAKGKVTLQKGNLFDVDVDTLKSDVSYADGRMSFTGGAGRMYNGTVKVSAWLSLPVVNTYSVDADLADVDSRPIFKFIGWDPGIQPGKVNGSLKTSGSEFDPEGSFEYRSTSRGKDVLGRIRDIAGRYKKQGPVIALEGVRLSTGLTEITATGKIDIDRKVLDIDGGLRTADLNDVVQPYFQKVQGKGRFSGRISGTFEDPEITGDIRVLNPAVGTFSAATLDAGVSYRKEVLNIRELTARAGGETYRFKGDVYFRSARNLFDFAGPEYRLSASLADADLGKVGKVFYPDFSGSGRLRSDIRIGGKGDNPVISGDAALGKATVFDIPFDSATFGWDYSDRKFTLRKMKINRGKSALAADVVIGEKGAFSFKAVSDRILLSDLTEREMKGDAVFSLRAEGGGTAENPSVSLMAKIKEGRLKGRPVGSGTVSAEVKNKEIAFRGSLLDDKVKLSGGGRYEKNLPWHARIEFQPGRYDPLVGAFLKDAPEDLILSLRGAIDLQGDRKHVYASSAMQQIMLSMYGYSFTNEREVKLQLKEGRLAFESVALRSGDTSLRIGGNLDLGKQYNMVVEGKSDISPFKSLLNKVAVMKGDADFVVSVTGDWDKPQLNGGVTLTNGVFGLKDYVYRLSSVNGYIYMDNDRVVLQNLTGKVGGGEVSASGVVYLTKFAVKRFYVEAAMNNITASVSSDFTLNFGGDVLYRGTPASQDITGDIRINRGRYAERVEWKSWLFSGKKPQKYKTEISEFEKAGLNIKITSKDNIRIDNNLARAGVSVDMLLRGTVFHPVLYGRLSTKEGMVYFRNNDFRILNASADFADPDKQPYLQIAAETSVRGYRIKLNLEGRLDHFTMALSADDPTLKDTDILSLLAVGQTGSQLKGMEGGIGAGEATSFVTGKLQDVIEERMQTIAGLDRFQIDPYVSRKTGAVEPRVTVSKRLIGDRMYVTYGSSVGSTEEQIVKLEYQLTNKISLIGQKDERGIIGGDVQFRFRFK